MDHPDCPPVGNIDHYLNRCYCALCTCGLHICPATIRQRRAENHDTWTTSYAKQFQPVQKDRIIPSLKVLPELSPIKARASKFRSEKSSYHVEYSPIKPGAPNPRFMPKSYSQSVLSLAKRSETKAQYPDWKSNNTRKPEIARETPTLYTFKNVGTS